MAPAESDDAASLNTQAGTLGTAPSTSPDNEICLISALMSRGSLGGQQNVMLVAICHGPTNYWQPTWKHRVWLKNGIT